MPIVYGSLQGIKGSWDSREFWGMPSLADCPPQASSVAPPLDGGIRRTEMNGENIRTKVAEELGKLAPKVETGIIAHLADKELNRRVEACVKVFTNLETAERELLKLQPDQGTYDEEGKRLTEWFSKARAEERKKLNEKINKIKNALTKALEKAEFKDVFDLANQPVKSDAKPASGEDKESS